MRSTDLLEIAAIFTKAAEVQSRIEAKAAEGIYYDIQLGLELKEVLEPARVALSVSKTYWNRKF